MPSKAPVPDVMRTEAVLLARVGTAARGDLVTRAAAET